MTELSIDSKKKTLRARVELLGEREPIELNVSKYSLSTKGGHPKLVIEEATASREWLTVALKEFVIGRTIELPEKAAVVLKLLG